MNKISEQLSKQPEKWKWLSVFGGLVSATSSRCGGCCSSIYRFLLSSSCMLSSLIYKYRFLVPIVNVFLTTCSCLTYLSIYIYAFIQCWLLYILILHQKYLLGCLSAPEFVPVSEESVTGINCFVDKYILILQDLKLHWSNLRSVCRGDLYKQVAGLGIKLWMKLFSVWRRRNRSRCLFQRRRRCLDCAMLLF